MIILANSHLRLEIAPERGAEVRSIGRPQGPNVVFFEDWRTPLRAGGSLSYGTTLMDWLSEYRGGWQELFPNAGEECEIDGVPLPYHGEVSGSEWEVLEHSASEIRLRSVARLPLVLERRMRISDEGPVLLIEEEVQNESQQPASFIWGHHPAFVAIPGMFIDLPAREVVADDRYDTSLVDVRAGAVGRWPLLAGKHGGDVNLETIPNNPIQRLCYLPNLSGWAALRETVSGRGLAMAWDTDVFPHAWLWEEVGGTDFPFYGRASIVAIEPVSAWPDDGLARAIERGQAHQLAGGDTMTSWLTFALFEATSRPVATVSRAGWVETK